MLVTAKNNYVLNAAQAKGLETTLEKIRADKAFAITTQESLAAQLRAAQTETQRNAIRQQMAKNSATIISLNRAERATVDELTAAQNRLNFASRALRGTMALLGGPVGAAMMLGGALFYVTEKVGETKQKALELNSVLKITVAELANLSKAQLGAKLIEYKKK
nr:hypothetical protein [Providencia stuartii]